MRFWLPVRYLDNPLSNLFHLPHTHAAPMCSTTLPLPRKLIFQTLRIRGSFLPAAGRWIGIPWARWMRRARLGARASRPRTVAGNDGNAPLRRQKALPIRIADGTPPPPAWLHTSHYSHTQPFETSRERCWPDNKKPFPAGKGAAKGGRTFLNGPNSHQYSGHHPPTASITLLTRRTKRPGSPGASYAFQRHS